MEDKTGATSQGSASGAGALGEILVSRSFAFASIVAVIGAFIIGRLG